MQKHPRLYKRSLEMSGTFDFLHPRSRYRGQFKPENLMFNANLQEFAQRVTYISNLETNGKMTPEESYKEIKTLWKQLKRTKKSLGIGQQPFQDGGEAEAS
jgi:hypothetical protein